MHIDERMRTVHVWSLHAEHDSVNAFAAFWPGYRIEWLGDTFEWQERTVGLVGIQPPIWQVAGVARDQLREYVARTARTNPAASIQAALARNGVDVQLTPATSAYVPSTAHPHAAIVLAALEAIAADPHARLNPARLVSEAGYIVEPR